MECSLEILGEKYVKFTINLLSFTAALFRCFYDMPYPKIFRMCLKVYFVDHFTKFPFVFVYLVKAEHLFARHPPMSTMYKMGNKNKHYL
jgi:hypothetical protein